ncbi:MAG: DUF4417 domain-containing protein [Anaerolineae bacterium]|nr:DUF4417 domain-containing protein [Anaerolineae bacterium]MCO5193058.1 DUF4417 domain-containing protein [Anaerolineae bacterium]
MKADPFGWFSAETGLPFGRMPSSPTANRPPPLGHDPLNGSRLFPADDPWGIPTLPLTAQPVPERLLRYRTLEHIIDSDAIHFFLDDLRFETVWRKLVKTVIALKQRTRLVLTPDSPFGKLHSQTMFISPNKTVQGHAWSYDHASINHDR